MRTFRTWFQLIKRKIFKDFKSQDGSEGEVPAKQSRGPAFEFLTLMPKAKRNSLYL